MSIVESEEVADIVELEDPGLVNRAVVVQTMAQLQVCKPLHLNAQEAQAPHKILGCTD